MPIERVGDDPVHQKLNAIELTADQALRIEALSIASVTANPEKDGKLRADAVVACAETYLRFLKGEPASAEVVPGPRAVP